MSSKQQQQQQNSSLLKVSGPQAPIFLPVLKILFGIQEVQVLAMNSSVEDLSQEEVSSTLSINTYSHSFSVKNYSLSIVIMFL